MMKKLLGGALAFALVSPAQAQVATATVTIDTGHSTLDKMLGK